jgi:DNA repair protein RadC
MDLAELAGVRGVGDAKSVRLKAALELGRRLAALSPDERPQIGSPEDIVNLLGIERWPRWSRNSCAWCS